GELAGQLVLVGSSAPGLADLRATPVHSSMPGVEVHAHLLAGLLDGRLPQRPAWAPGFEAVLIVLALTLAALTGSRLSAPRALLAMFALTGLLIVSNLAAYALAALVLPVASALVLAGLLFAGMTSASYLREWKSRRSLMQLFSSYVPPDRARQLARDPSQQHIAAANCELTLLFCDLRGFSGIAETLPPLALRDLLNEYLSQATEIVHRHGGTLDKFIGDAVMAFWGAPQPQPDHAVRAVRAALELTESMAPLNVSLLARGLPAVRFGIGLATGVVCVGDLGSKLRRSYTAVGDAVNLAARLESLTREVEVDLLVSDSTHAACLQTKTNNALGADVVWAEVDQCLVRGRRQLVTIFTPLTAAPDNVPMLQEQVRTWRLALRAAQQHHVSDAHSHLARLNALLALNPTSALSLAPGHNTAGWTLQMLSERLSRQLRTGQPLSPASGPLSRPAAL
ncbi:MAG TPA: adenylate/guanylate cyclase domain-containing protein, partial [Ideonella sp.]|nr:adenylate/guanylate cyclase domain-containing protein [Ideonella sp.]